MYPPRPLLIIIRPTHIRLTRAGIDDEQDFGGDLRTEERRFVVSGLLPFGEIVRDLGELDARRCLGVAGV